MLVGIGDVYAQALERRAAERMMLAAQAAARRQDGCISYVFAEVLDEPGHFVVVQRWRDSSALEQHFRSDSFASYQRAIAPILVRESELELHRAEETVRPVEASGLDLRQDD